MKNNLCPDGLRPARKKGNFREKVFAEAWKEEHSRAWDQTDFLGLLLSKTQKEKDGITNITQRERVIVATVIQWLGSNVGMGFLHQCMNKIGITLENRDDYELLSNGWSKVQNNRWVLLRDDMPFKVSEPQTKHNALLLISMFQNNKWD